MKKGTIIKNHWAGEGNPTMYSIYLGTSGKYVNTIRLVNGKLCKGQYYKSDFKNREKFEIVGYSKAFNIMKEDLKKWLND